MSITSPLCEGDGAPGHRKCWDRPLCLQSSQARATDLQELEVDVREAAGPQLHLQWAERGEQLQGNDGTQARPHRRHTLHVLQLPQPQAPDGGCIDVLVLPPAGQGGAGEEGHLEVTGGS